MLSDTPSLSRSVSQCTCVNLTSVPYNKNLKIKKKNHSPAIVGLSSISIDIFNWRNRCTRLGRCPPCLEALGSVNRSMWTRRRPCSYAQSPWIACTESLAAATLFTSCRGAVSSLHSWPDLWAGGVGRPAGRPVDRGLRRVELACGVLGCD